jgi:hypothetical protein
MEGLSFHFLLALFNIVELYILCFLILLVSDVLSSLCTSGWVADECGWGRMYGWKNQIEKFYLGPIPLKLYFFLSHKRLYC